SVAAHSRQSLRGAKRSHLENLAIATCYSLHGTFAVRDVRPASVKRFVQRSYLQTDGKAANALRPVPKAIPAAVLDIVGLHPAQLCPDEVIPRRLHPRLKIVGSRCHVSPLHVEDVEEFFACKLDTELFAELAVRVAPLFPPQLVLKVIVLVRKDALFV